MKRLLANAVVVYAFTLFVSATLLFFIELLVPKMILPKFGGTPAVWNTCMVFFQAALLAGYAYAHLATTYLRLRTQVIIQVVLLVLCVILLPITVSESWAPPGDAHPIPYVLGLLLTTVGLPFFVISTSAPLLQKWFAESGDPSANDPYFLYAASNVGSMMALLGYPILVEPVLTIMAQSWTWAVGYIGLLGLVGYCGYRLWHAPSAVAEAEAATRGAKDVEAPSAEESRPAMAAPQALAPSDSENGENGEAEATETAVTATAPVGSATTTEDAPSKGGKKKKRKGGKSGGWKESITRTPAKSSTAFTTGRRDDAPEMDFSRDREPLTERAPTIWNVAHWIALAFIPSSLMLGVTTYLTTDIASIPLLWIPPLALYLLTFIIVFSRVPPIVHTAMVLAMPVIVLLLVFLMVSEIRISWIGWSFLLHLTALFVVSMVCHGELARKRPSTRYLTGFFLCMSFGGVLGGIFNALVAPVVFDSVAEYSLVLVMACMLLPPFDSEKPNPLNFYLDIGLAVALGMAAIYAVYKLIGTHELDDVIAITGIHSPFWAWSVIFTILGMLVVYALVARPQQRMTRWLDIGLPIALGLLTAQLIYGSPFARWEIVKSMARGMDVSPDRMVKVLTFGLPVALCYGFAEQPIRFGLGVAAIFLAGLFNSNESAFVLHQERSFFGVLKVEKRYGNYNRLLHGTTLHGMQRGDSLALQLLPLSGTDPFDMAWKTLYGPAESTERRLEPLTYYHRTGPVGQAYAEYCAPTLNNSWAKLDLEVLSGKPLSWPWDWTNRVEVAFIGMGTGTMASYVEPGQHGTFYEIDPAIIRIAEDPKYFTYLRDCRGELQEDGRRYKIALGDARLKMRDAPDGTYKLIVVDAFSSDAIPIHLITKEALKMYVDKLAPDGVVAIHISNRHLRLGPVLGNIVRDLGIAGVKQYDNDEGASGKNTSDWVVIAKNMDVLSRLRSSDPTVPEEKQRWEILKGSPKHRTWTDDYSNLLDVLRWE
ncbi:MAG: fused MFS/spermidine synthase [Gemmataceae bacterium]|nr:fused MFS/spermidine synthase [Gemmataceae bacterium]